MEYLKALIKENEEKYKVYCMGEWGRPTPKPLPDGFHAFVEQRFMKTE